MKIKKLEFCKHDNAFSIDQPYIAQTPLGTIYKISRDYKLFTVEYLLGDFIIDKHSGLPSIEAARGYAQLHFERIINNCYE